MTEQQIQSKIIKKLESRNYIKRIGTAYESTNTGQDIIKVFDQIWPDLVTPKFTRQVELQMDEVASKKVSYENMLETIRKKYLLLHHHLLSKLPELQDLLKQSFKFQTRSGPYQTRVSNKTAVKRKQGRHRGKNSFNCPVCSEGSMILHLYITSIDTVTTTMSSLKITDGTHYLLKKMWF